MADTEFMKWLATLGVGGVLAGLMFMFYRKDVKQYTELWKLATDQLMSVVKENTLSNARLISLIEVQERNALRKDDIVHLIEKLYNVDQRVERNTEKIAEQRRQGKHE